MLGYWRSVCTRESREGPLSPLWAIICASLLLHSIASLPAYHYHDGVPHTHDFGAYAHDHNALPLHLHEGHTHAHGRFGVHSHGGGHDHAASLAHPQDLRNGGERPGKTEDKRGNHPGAAPSSHFCSQSAPGLPAGAEAVPQPIPVAREALAERVAPTPFRVCLSYDNRAPPACL